MQNQLKMKGSTACYMLRLTSEGAALAVQDKKTEERFGQCLKMKLPQHYIFKFYLYRSYFIKYRAIAKDKLGD